MGTGVSLGRKVKRSLLRRKEIQGGKFLDGGETK